MSAPTPSPARVPYLGTYILPYLPLHTNQMSAPTPSPARATIPRYLHLPLHTDQMSAPTPSPARVPYLVRFSATSLLVQQQVVVGFGLAVELLLVLGRCWLPWCGGEKQ